MWGGGGGSEFRLSMEIRCSVLRKALVTFRSLAAVFRGTFINQPHVLSLCEILIFCASAISVSQYPYATKVVKRKLAREAILSTQQVSSWSVANQTE